MTPDHMDIDASQLADRWWALVLRGAAAILFGGLAFAMPGLGLLALVILWGSYALVDGVFNLVLAVRGARAGRRWGWLMLEGVLSIAAGVIAFAWPSITALALLVMIAVWAVLTGIAELAVAIRLRKVIRGEWLLALSGILSVVFGVLMLLFPGSGALALIWVIGAYAIVFGALLIGLGIRLRGWRRRVAARSGAKSYVPAGGMHEHRPAT